jgi:hypothetical protein
VSTFPTISRRPLGAARAADSASRRRLAEFTARLTLCRGQSPCRARGARPCTLQMRVVPCNARLVEVRPNTSPAGGAAVQLSAVEVRALYNILGLVAGGGMLTEKPEREMARRLQTELEKALGDG